MRHSAPAREAMPQKRGRRQAKGIFAAAEVARMALRLFAKNFCLFAAKILLVNARAERHSLKTRLQ